MDPVMGSGLGMEVASGSISGTNALAGCSSVVGSNTHTWSIGSGSISMMGLGVEFRSMAEDLSSCLGLSRLVQDRELLLMEYVPGSWRASFSTTPKVREDPHSHSV